MDKQPEAEQKKENQPQNGQPKVVVKDEVSITVKESREETHEETDEEAEKKYQEDLKKYHQEVERVKIFAHELKELFHKSQDTFEKQLSYISAGALALSVGFIKDIVHPIKSSSYKWMLLAGWVLLIFTLLLNLISHMLAAKYARKGAKEAEDPDNTYDPTKIEKRARRMERINWATVGTLAGGIILIVLYITFNAIL
jgi:hypothetical protein